MGEILSILFRRLRKEYIDLYLSCEKSSIDFGDEKCC